MLLCNPQLIQIDGSQPHAMSCHDMLYLVYLEFFIIPVSYAYPIGVNRYGIYPRNECIDLGNLSRSRRATGK